MCLRRVPLLSLHERTEGTSADDCPWGQRCLSTVWPPALRCSKDSDSLGRATQPEGVCWGAKGSSVVKVDAMVWCGVGGYGMVWCGEGRWLWYGVVWAAMVWYGEGRRLWYVVVKVGSYSMVWCGVVKVGGYSMVWCGEGRWL